MSIKSTDPELHRTLNHKRKDLLESLFQLRGPLMGDMVFGL